MYSPMCSLANITFVLGQTAHSLKIPIPMTQIIHLILVVCMSWTATHHVVLVVVGVEIDAHAGGQLHLEQPEIEVAQLVQYLFTVLQQWMPHPCHNSLQQMTKEVLQQWMPHLCHNCLQQMPREHPP